MALTDEQSGTPQLTNHGVRVLSDVLARRAVDRHNTLSAQRNARRRQADALRVPVEPIGEPQPGAEVVEIEVDVELEPDVDHAELDEIRREGDDGPNWGILISLGIAIGVCIALALSLEARPAGLDVSPASAPAQSAAVAPVLVQLEFEVIEVAPLAADVRSFAISVRNESVEATIRTDELSVALEDEDGNSVPTLIRFDRQQIPPGDVSSATARAEGADSGDVYIRVQVGSRTVERRLLPEAVSE